MMSKSRTIIAYNDVFHNIVSSGRILSKQSSTGYTDGTVLDQDSQDSSSKFEAMVAHADVEIAKEKTAEMSS